MTSADTAATAEIHRRELPHGFFAALGPRFLSTYHRTFVDSPHGVAIVALLDGRVAGFLVGTLGTGPHYRWVVRQRGLRLAVRAVGGLLAHPSAMAAFVQHRLGRYAKGLRRFLSPSEPSIGEGQRGRGPVAVLTHVAVLPGARGEGLGVGLVEHFVHAVHDAGIREMRLVTLAGDAGASTFYEEHGWDRLRERAGADGHQVVEFRRTS